MGYARRSVAGCGGRIPVYGGRAEEPAGDNRSRRRVPVAEMNAFIVEVVPRHGITRQISQRVVRHSLRGRKKHGVMGRCVSGGETVNRPTKSTRPGRVRAVALMGVRENPFPRGGGIFGL